MLGNEKKHGRKYGIVTALLIAVVSSMLVPTTTKVAVAASPNDPEKAADPGIRCGNQYWGIKTDTDLSGTWAWGKKADCTMDTTKPAIGGRINYVKTHVSYGILEPFHVSQLSSWSGEDAIVFTFRK
ncbi:MAG: hypothetical protein ABI347_02470 [Nitrososphaera sp.]|jgi:hypothetical protein